MHAKNSSVLLTFDMKCLYFDVMWEDLELELSLTLDEAYRRVIAFLAAEQD